jgi:hypothetical protein
MRCLYELCSPGPQYLYDIESDHDWLFSRKEFNDRSDSERESGNASVGPPIGRWIQSHLIGNVPTGVADRSPLNYVKGGVSLSTTRRMIIETALTRTDEPQYYRAIVDLAGKTRNPRGRD